MLPLERHEFYKKRLSDQLNTAGIHIGVHFKLINDHVKELSDLAEHMWRLSQRHKIVARSKETSADSLLHAYNKTHSALREIIESWQITLKDIRSDVVNFQQECCALEDEVQAPLQPLLLDWLEWLAETQSVFFTQAKYLQMGIHNMAPLRMERKMVEQFKKDSQLPEQYVASIALGLARLTHQLSTGSANLLPPVS